MKSDIIILFWIIFFRLSKEDECLSNSDNAYCCDGFYRNATSGKCDECPIGYFGMHCNSECLGGYFGKTCHFMCNCTDRQICNHVYGCVDMTTTDLFTTRQSVSTEKQTMMVITKSTATLTTSQTVLTQQQQKTILPLWVYIIITAVIIVVIVGVLAVRSKLTQSVHVNEKTVQFRQRAIPEININEPGEESTGQEDDIYCEIRDSQIARDSHLLPCQSQSSAVTNSNTLRDSNVYNHLNFCQSSPNLNSCFGDIYDQSNPILY